MIGDSIVDLTNWLLQTFLYPLFPTNFPFLPFNTYYETLQNIKGNAIFVFSYVEKFFPIQLLLTLLSVMLVAEIILFGIKGIMYLINLSRGSGA